ncbi:NAD(P)-dependent oxidoreductase [Photobacterium leiognathi subsp. mandapamensis]|uniref:NAD(P)-dependent oxidoreductase n=1 Tax=Photobacterium leiognathi TaxID=553611 RepID=UPI000D16E8B6|nr:NAD(P)-dependent oxidoreductase [Photobacterium leiognathi]PSW65238.1 NAD(P)-dependent oxidoreductase [Photobacterium leiognathi subsp. mandapamensis]
MNNAIIGYTGFVGSNICKQRTFEYLYNSKNIQDICGKEFDELVITGVPAVKWLANKEPKKDIENIESLISNLKTVKAKCVVLISTVDVYPYPIDVNEGTIIDKDECQPYGKHRLYFEEFVKKNFNNVHVMRLPGLFGSGLKKNIIFDFLTNNMIDSIESRNSFQFYCLDTISKDIDITIKNNISLVNMAVEPITVKEVAGLCGISEFNNELDRPLVSYDFKTEYSKYWNECNSDYIYDKSHCIEMLKRFIKEF